MGAFVRREGVEERSDAPPCFFVGSFGGFAEQVFELGEDLLDWVQVRAVGRQEQQASALGADGGADGWVLVAGEVVEDDDIASAECRAQFFLDPLGEGCAIDRLIEDERRVDPVAAQSGDERHRLPVAVRHLGVEALSLGRPAAQGSHVRLGPGLVDEHEAAGIRPVLELLPLLASPRHLGAQLLGGQHAFF